MSSKGAKIAYRPIGLLGGILAGTISGAIFKQVWKRVAHQDDAPDALQSEYPMSQVIISAANCGLVWNDQSTRPRPPSTAPAPRASPS